MEYEVSLTMQFDEDFINSPEEAVSEMFGWVETYASMAGYVVSWVDENGAKQRKLYDIEDVMRNV